MRHLCTKCATLSVEQDSVLTIKDVVQREGGPITHVLSDPFFENLTALKESANGTAANKGCHLCALLLHSLKHPRTIGTFNEEDNIPSSAISLILRVAMDKTELFAKIGDYAGYPLTCSAESDDGCRGQEISPNADSYEIFALIKRWCEDCFQKHEKCHGTSGQDAWLPDRVIDVGPSDGSKEPCLWISQGHAGKYVSLTHRWRPQGMSFTSTSNFEERKTLLSMSSLPLTFQDAVHITRRLGIRYLWIDALCIIQDSAEDWSRQSRNMMSIYELSWLNIAATGSEVEPGFFLKRNPRLSRRARLPQSLSGILPTISGSDESVYVHLGSEFYAKAAYDGFLSQRGWVLQERILSPRTVYFGKEEIFWECSTETASEATPWGHVEDIVWPMVKLRSPNGPPNMVRYWPDYSARAFEQHQKPKSEMFLPIHDSVLDEIHTYWHRTVEKFSTLKFTDPLDKLPAIEGLARSLHKSHIQGGSFEDEYSDGHWIGDMYRSLLWYPASPGERNRLNTQTAPSWSWASYDGGVKLLPNIREDHIWRSRNPYCQDPILQYIQGENPVANKPIEEFGLPLHAEPEHSTSINYHWKVGAMRSAQLRLDSNQEKGTQSIEDSPWLANARGFPIAKVLLDRDLQLDKTVVDYLTDSDWTVYCMQTVLRHSADSSSLLDGNPKTQKDVVVSVSINGLVLIPFAWAKRVAFRRIGIFVDRSEAYNESLFFGTMTLI